MNTEQSLTTTISPLASIYGFDTLVGKLTPYDGPVGALVAGTAVTTGIWTLVTEPASKVAPLGALAEGTTVLSIFTVTTFDIEYPGSGEVTCRVTVSP